MYLSAWMTSGSFSPSVFGFAGSSSATSVLRPALALFAIGPSDSGLAALLSSSAFFAAIDFVFGPASGASASSPDWASPLFPGFAFPDLESWFAAAGLALLSARGFASMTEESSSSSAAEDPAEYFASVELLFALAASALVFEAVFALGFAVLSGITGPLGSTVAPLRARIDAKSGP